MIAEFEWNRANGIAPHQGLQAVHREILIASPGVPTFAPVPAPVPPIPVPVPESSMLSNDICASIIGARVLSNTHGQAAPARDRIVYMLTVVLPPDLAARGIKFIDVADSQRLHWLSLTEDGIPSAEASDRVFGPVPV